MYKTVVLQASLQILYINIRDSGFAVPAVTVLASWFWLHGPAFTLMDSRFWIRSSCRLHGSVPASRFWLCDSRGQLLTVPVVMVLASRFWFRSSDVAVPAPNCSDSTVSGHKFCFMISTVMVLHHGSDFAILGSRFCFPLPRFWLHSTSATAQASRFWLCGPGFVVLISQSSLHGSGLVVQFLLPWYVSIGIVSVCWAKVANLYCKLNRLILSETTLASSMSSSKLSSHPGSLHNSEHLMQLSMSQESLALRNWVVINSEGIAKGACRYYCIEFSANIMKYIIMYMNP